MAGSKLKARVRSSSILEVIVSMVIIVVVFGIAMMIYTNVLRLSLSGKKLKAQALLNETMVKTEHNTQVSAQSITVDDFTIELEVKPCPLGLNLSEIHLTAFDQNRQKVAELEKVIDNSHE